MKLGFREEITSRVAEMFGVETLVNDPKFPLLSLPLNNVGDIRACDSVKYIPVLPLVSQISDHLGS